MSRVLVSWFGATDLRAAKPYAGVSTAILVIARGGNIAKLKTLEVEITNDLAELEGML